MWSTGSDLFAACTRHTTAVDDADGTIIAPPVTLAYAYATAHVTGGVAKTTAAAAVAYGTLWPAASAALASEEHARSTGSNAIASTTASTLARPHPSTCEQTPQPSTCCRHRQHHSCGAMPTMCTRV